MIYYSAPAGCFIVVAILVGAWVSRALQAPPAYVCLVVAGVFACDLPVRWLMNQARSRRCRTDIWPFSRSVGGHVGFIPIWVWSFVLVGLAVVTFREDREKAAARNPPPAPALPATPPPPTRPEEGVALSLAPEGRFLRVRIRNGNALPLTGVMVAFHSKTTTEATPAVSSWPLGNIAAGMEGETSLERWGKTESVRFILTATAGGKRFEKSALWSPRPGEAVAPPRPEVKVALVLSPEEDGRTLRARVRNNHPFRLHDVRLNFTRDDGQPRLAPLREFTSAGLDPGQEWSESIPLPASGKGVVVFFDGKDASKETYGKSASWPLPRR